MTWGLSIKALITRAQKTKAIDADAAVRLYKRYSARGYNDVEPYPLNPETATLVTSAVDVHLRDHGYTVDELATDVVFLERDEFEEALLGRRRIYDGDVVSLSRHRA